MSVTNFDSAELGNVAAVLAHGADEKVIRYAALLAEVSKCNVRAFDATYRERNTSVTAEEIAAAAPSLPRMSFDAALSTVSLLAYNCVANNGRNYLSTKPAMKALVEIQSTALQLAGSRARTMRAA